MPAVKSYDSLKRGKIILFLGTNQFNLKLSSDG